MEDRLPDNFIDPRLSEDKLNLNENKLPDNFIDPRQAQEEPEEPSILGEIPKGLKAGVQQLRGMGYGLGALAGQAVGSESVLDWAREGLKDVEEKTPKPAVGSISDIESVSDSLKYLTYGVTSNLPNMALSLTGGGIGAGIGVGIAKKKLLGEVAKQSLKKTGMLVGAGASSLGMEAGSIAGDQLTETGKVDPVRAMLGAIPAAALDVVPEWYLFKRLGIFGDVTEEVKKGLKNRLLRGGKDFAKQFGMEAPTEAMQSVIERASVPGKSITNKEAWDEYINSFVLGGATGGIVGGAGGVFARTQKEASEETPVQKIIKEDPTANDIEIQLVEADPEGVTKVELAKGDIETKAKIQAMREAPATKEEFVESKTDGRFTLVGSRLRGDNKPTSDYDVVTRLTPEESNLLDTTPEGEYPRIPQDVKDRVYSDTGQVFIEDNGKLYAVDKHPEAEGEVWVQGISDLKQNILTGTKKGETPKKEFTSLEDTLDEAYKEQVAEAPMEEQPAPEETTNILAPEEAEVTTKVKDPLKMTNEELIAQGYIPVYRGTGKLGYDGVKPSEGGVYGEGAYFYTDPSPARSHATTGGGVITGFIKPEDAVIKGNVAVVKDVSKFIQRGKIPVEDTIQGGSEWVAKTEKALANTEEAKTPEAPKVGEAVASDLAPKPEAKGEDRLYHGTTFGNEFDKFSLEKANWGVGSNPIAQGNKGIYLNDDYGTTRYFSRKANEFNALMQGDRSPEKVLKAQDEAWEYLFGKEATKRENIKEVTLDKDIRIKELNHYPTKDEIDGIIASGKYDAVRFPEKGIESVEDIPEDLLKEIKNSKTTFVFNLDKVNLKPKPATTTAPSLPEATLSGDATSDISFQEGKDKGEIGAELTDIEQKAIKVGENKNQLRKRLQEAVSVMTKEARGVFKDATFDFENKRLVSKDGKVALQWKTRPNPDKPVSYENQQTSVGTVVVEKQAKPEQYAVGTETKGQALSLDNVKSIFKGQNITQDGGNFTVTLKNGATIPIQGVVSITPNETALQLGHGQTALKQGQKVLGAYEGDRIRIVRDSENAPWTVAHESIHWLEDLGIINSQDQVAIASQAKKEGKWKKDLSPSENRANWLADFTTNPRPEKGTLGKIWDKIKDFVNSIIGTRTAEQIGRELQSGKLFEKQAQANEFAQPAKYSLKSAVTNILANPKFKKWFGDSKVVDEKGEPLVVYHGTGAEFNDFKSKYPNLLGKFPESTGFYFTSSYADADEFSYIRSQGDGKAKVMPSYISIQNPLIVNYKGRLFDIVHMQRYIKQAIENGNDGVIVQNIKNFSGFKKSDTYIAFEPTQIKSIYNTGEFSPTNPDIRYALSRTWEDTQPTWSENMRRLVIDARNDTKEVVKSISKVMEVEEKNNPALMAELASSKAVQAFEDVKVTEYLPALDEMVKAKVSMQDMHEYLLNRHAEEANIAVAEIQKKIWEKQNPKTRPLEPPLQDKGSSVATEDAREYLKSLSKDPARKATLERLAKPFDNILKGSIEALVEAKMLSRKEADVILKKYKHFVPLLRPEMEIEGGTFGTGQGFSTLSNSLIGRKGSEKDVGNIIVNIMAQRESIYRRIENNTVGKAVAGLQNLAPKPEFWNKARPRVVPMIEAETGDIKNVLDRNYLKEPNVLAYLDTEMQDVIDPKTGEKVLDSKGKPVKEEVVVRKGIEFATDNQRAMGMVTGLKNLNKEDMNKVLDWSAKVTRFVASMNTQWNVLFGPVNFVRDFQFAMASISATELKGKQKEIASLVIPALSTVYKASRNMKEALASEDPVMKRYMEFRAHGAPTSYRDIYKTNKDKVRALNKEIALLEKGGGVEKAFKKAVGITLDWISDYNSSLENATRFAVYQTARNSGLSADKSASLAKNVTVNFDRKGQLSQQAGALWAFFNASAQGLDALARTLNGPKGKKIIAGGILLGAMQAMALSAAGFDDEDEPPQFIRERSVIIPIGGTKFITVPMPLGFNFIPNIGRIFTEWAMSGGKNTSGRVLDLMGMFVESFNPMGASGMSLQTFMPTPLDPFVALAENKDWTGKPIYRENYSALNPTPGFTRTKDTASGFAKGLSWALNKMSGGTDNVPGFWSPTPDQIEYLMGQASGGVGRETIKAQQAIEATIKGDELPSYKIPLIGRFYGNTAGQAQTASKFYGNIKKLNMHEAEIKDKKKTGKERAEYLKDNPEARYWQLANKTEGIVRKLNGRKRELKDRGAGKDTLRNIDNLITNHMKRLNESVSRATN